MVDLAEFLGGLFGNPAVYLLATFGYSVLVAIVLPTPIEIAILLPLLPPNPNYTLFALAVVAMAAGKTVGAWLIFRLGLRVDKQFRFWTRKYRVVNRVVEALDRFVRKTGYMGLYILLSVPLMSDTLPVYLYSLFNADGKVLSQRTFLASNFLAALNRSAILVLLFVATVNLFGI